MGSGEEGSLDKLCGWHTRYRSFNYSLRSGCLKGVELEGNGRSEFLQLAKLAEDEQSRHLENRGLVAAVSDICLYEKPSSTQC
jgi:hypothetical protein